MLRKKRLREKEMNTKKRTQVHEEIEFDCNNSNESLANFEDYSKILSNDCGDKEMAAFETFVPAI